MGGTDKKIKSKKPTKKTATIIPRDEWGAQPIKGHVAKLKHPVSHIRYGHTGTDKCRIRNKCLPILQAYQETFLDREYADQPFNFLITAEGVIYEGRGWDLDAERPEKINKKIRGKAIDIGYVGSFSSEEELLEPMIEANKLFLELALEENYIQGLPKILSLKDYVPLFED